MPSPRSNRLPVGDLQGVLVANPEDVDQDGAPALVLLPRLRVREGPEAGFEVGTRTTVDVLDARRQLFITETNYFRRRYDYIVNWLRLKQAAGNLTVADLSLVNGWLQQ